MTDQRFSIRSLCTGAVCCLMLAATLSPPWAFGCIHPRFHWVLVLLVYATLCAWLPLFFVGKTSRKVSWPHLFPLLLIAAVGMLQVVELPRPVLSLLSPTTVELQDSLMPAAREVGLNGVPIDEPSWSASNRVSLYPAETFKQTIWFCLLVSLFLVAQTIFTRKITRWLLTALVINGALLSWIAITTLLQPDGSRVLTWEREIWGERFGSFLNKNHFALYINICLGAAIERWLSRYRSSNSSGKPLQSDWQFLLISLAIVSMLATLMISQSRGAVASGIVAAAVTAAVFGTKDQRKSRLVLGGVGFVVSLGFAIWIYDDLHKSRIASFLLGGELLDVGRLQMWQRMSVLISWFPVLGTGTGTIPFVEPLTRRESIPQIVRYAHNDYLQVLIENGFAVFAVLLLFMWRVFAAKPAEKSTSKADRDRSSAQPGIFFALFAAAFHGLVEFGMRMPGIAATVVVLAGCYVGNSLPRRRFKKRPEPLSMWKQLPLLAFSLATGFIAIQHFAALRTADREIAQMDLLEQDDPRAVQHLARAVAAYPWAIDWQLLLGEELSVASSDPDRLLAAQQHAVHARDLCPIFATAQVDLAKMAGTFQSADDPITYLSRAERLEPKSPSLFFVAGKARNHFGDTEGAIERWRESITLSPEHMKEIVEGMVAAGYTEQQVEAVVPDHADRLYAASQVSRRSTKGSPLASETLRDAWLARTLKELMSVAETVENSRLIHRRASIASSLGSIEQAIADYESATTLQPNQTSWRIEFARLLVQNQRYERAREELRLLVRMNESPEALRLLRDVSRRIDDDSV